MKTIYCKFANNLLYQRFSTKNRITVCLYDFHTGIDISTYNIKNLDLTNMIECSKLEFDKAYNLALALISNKSLNEYIP